MRKFNFCLSKEITTALIALLGVLLGGVIAGYYNDQVSKRQAEFNEQLWKKQAGYEFKRTLFIKRLELIDKTSFAFGRAPGIEDIWEEYIAAKTEKNNDRVIELGEKLANFNAEYSSLIMQDSLYFGPNTRIAIDELGKETGPWWKKSRDKVDKLLGAMVQELNDYSNIKTE